MKNILATIQAKIVRLGVMFYYYVYRPLKIWQIRHKKSIKVGFVIGCLSAWKTELLYLMMLKHERFSPMLLVMETREENDIENIIAYLKKRNYEYRVVERNEYLIRKFQADILFYQKPYDGIPFKRHSYKLNLYALFCYVGYGFNTVNEKWGHDNVLDNIAWQLYFENESVIGDMRKIMRNKCINGHVTGLPIMDELLVDKKQLQDPWKPQMKMKKRIIWAPHFTINPGGWLVYSTFLNIADFMLELAHQYKEEVQFAFKPHPLLWYKLCEVWGEEKTNAYYQQWATLENTQLEQGKYLGLFKYSDALIHDCGSFTVEYHYTLNPVMYIVKDDHHADNQTSFAKRAFELHYKAYTKQDIEYFIQNIVAGQDEKKAERIKFYQEELLPPHGKSACENIIDTILQALSTTSCVNGNI